MDAPANTAEPFDVIDEVTEKHGLLTSELVPALVSDEAEIGHGVPPLARHPY